MKTIIEALRIHLDAVEDRLDCFSRYEVQVEAWLKGEILTFLDRLKRDRRIAGFDREVSINGGKIDLAIDVGSVRHWVELKHWLIGRQKGAKWRATAYVDGLENEVAKLADVKAAKNGWILALCTKNPGPQDWTALVDKFNKDHAPARIVPRSIPEDYPETYFLGLLQVNNGET